MFAVSKKTFLAFVVFMVVLTTGAWQSAPVALAQNQNADGVETPLFPGVTWESLGASTQDIRINANGDSVSVQGERFEAQQQFLAGEPLPEDVVGYYSTEQLGSLGWESYDTVEGADGVRYVYYQQSGEFLSVEFLACENDPSKACVYVWQSEPVSPDAIASASTSEPGAEPAASTFGKTSPSNGATGLNPSNTVLSWQAYSPTPDKYSYCVKEGEACDPGDPNWTSTFNTSVTLTNLAYNKTYYWQVKAITCVDCTPKTVVYANGGTAWTFKTKSTVESTILGNAGVPAAVLSYVVSGTTKTVTADSTGAYAIKVPYGWTGTLTPSKSGYLFTPKSATFTNVTAAQTIQNFTAIVARTISGNAGVAGATLSYTDGTPKTVIANSTGNYSIVVPYGWSGTITPSKPGYSFNPPNRSYANVTSDLTAQNFTATFVTYTITGNAGVGGAVLNYVNGTARFAVADNSGNYTITVPMGWSGTVTPHKVAYSFTPGSKSYTNVQANQTAQNYTAQSCASCADKDTVGVFRPSAGLWYLKNGNFLSFSDSSVNYGLPGDLPITGDWDGNGSDTIGIYRNGTFLLRNSNASGVADVTIPFGQAGDLPVAGDWDGDGDDNIGIYRPTTAQFFLKFSNSAGAADLVFFLGKRGDVPIAGDWDGDGIDTTGVFRPSDGMIFLKNINGSGFADISLNYGLAGDKPIVGDWDNNGTTTIGVYRKGSFYLRNSNTNGFADIVFALGNSGDLPVAGNWDALP